MPEAQVFISYSHVDRDWLERLQTHLKPHLRAGSIKSWSDQQIAPGSEWFKEIQSALANSKVAVLLVSPDFLASDFVHEHESGPLLKQAEQGGVKILWVPVRASAYKKTALRDYQAVLDPAQPLANMKDAERDQAWVKICDEIEKAIKTSKEPFPEDATNESALPVVAPPVDGNPDSPGRNPHSRNISLAIGGILVLMIVTLAIRFLMPWNINQPMPPVANEVKIGDKFFLRSREGSYVMTATPRQFSDTRWPRLGNDGKVALKLLGNGPLRDKSVVQIQSLRACPADGCT